MRFLFASVLILVAQVSSAASDIQDNMDIPSPSLRTRQLVTSYGFDCDCSASCTSEVLNYFAGPYKVGDRIKWLIESQAYGEQEACTTVCGSEFPDLCGTQCNPHACKTNISTPLPTAIPTQSPTQSMCGCKSCTQSILDTIAYDTSGGFTCRSRINWVMTERSLTEYDACVQVSGEFPNVCGQGCNPLQCTSNQTPTDKPTLKPSKSPTMSPSGNPTNSPTTVPTKYPTKSPTKAPTPSPMTNPEPFPCGCESCTQSVLGTIAYDAGGGYSCSARMDWLMTTQEGGYLPEYDACVRISSEFPDVCGPSCDPNRCNPVVVPQPDPTKLVWSDEFDTEGLPDPALWDYDIGGWGWGNNELQYYTDRPENAYISNGVLNIRAVKENYQNRDYTSARLVTKNLGDWTYGRVLVRARLLHCTGRGTWPAIWMLPTDWVYGGWPQSGEIDIMEHVGYDVGRVHGTVHTEAFNHGIGTQVGSSITIDVNDWHVYEVIWSIDKILFVVDGEKYHEFRRIDSASYREWPFDQRFHLLLNVAVGGNWGGAYGIDSTAFESAGQTMEIDWVRVYSS